MGVLISIHALRGEGDSSGAGLAHNNKKISIHALRGEGDADIVEVQNIQIKYFNPRPPWGGRLLSPAPSSLTKEFQSTPSVGRATYRRSSSEYILRFQSTPSVGRATPHGLKHLKD